MTDHAESARTPTETANEILQGVGYALLAVHGELKRLADADEGVQRREETKRILAERKASDPENENATRDGGAPEKPMDPAHEGF